MTAAAWPREPFPGDVRPLWMRALATRILETRVGCTAISITTASRCKCRAFSLNSQGDPRCGNHART